MWLGYGWAGSIGTAVDEALEAGGGADATPVVAQPASANALINDSIKQVDAKLH